MSDVLVWPVLTFALFYILYLHNKIDKMATTLRNISSVLEFVSKRN